MWSARFWSGVLWAARFWAKHGQIITPVVGGRVERSSAAVSGAVVVSSAVAGPQRLSVSTAGPEAMGAV